MTKLIALAILAACSLTLIHAQQDWPKIVQSKNLYAEHDFRGKKAPAFFIQKWLNVAEVDRRGKVLVIEFFATGSDLCQRMVPELNDFSRKFKDKVIVMGISDEAAEPVQAFIKSTGAEFSIGIDRKHHMMSELGGKGIPYALVISADNIVRWQGFPHDDDDRLTDKIIQQVIDAGAAKPIKIK